MKVSTPSHPVFYMLVITLVVLLSACTSKPKHDNLAANGNHDAWSDAAQILKRINPPAFPDRDFQVADYGALGDGSFDNTAAFKAAIEACSNAGGGRVVVPEGRYLTGPVYLKSNVNFHISKGAVLLFSTRPGDYLPVVATRWEGVELMNYSPLIYAYKEKNIAVTGEGLLDGQASKEHWWPWSSGTDYGYSEGMPSQKDPGNRKALFAMAENGVPVSERVFGEGHYLRPQFVQPYLCENVLLQDFTIINSPMWVIHPVLCENVSIRNLTINSNGPNSDGCDPESCRNVLIEGCTFNTGDDCIAIKSGRNEDGRRINRPSENIIVRNCEMKDGHGGLVIGSEISAGARNIYIEDCKMDSPNLTRAIRLKTNSARGGTIDGVYARHIEVGEVEETLLKVNMVYEEGEGHGYVPVVKNIRLENINCRKTRFPLFLLGSSESEISDIVLKNVLIEDAREASVLRYVTNITLENVKFQTSREVNIWGTVK
ncbi:glycoside hydrolase family 28 protein [Roseimarinus sediminis]|uniref:glycoside hydrolase family 28 protein n=1 Tax=Roseimarinus sediminis TaxID=1610899 RepID=UPI003D19D858